MERKIKFRAFDTKLKRMMELDRFWHIFDDDGYSISQSKDYQPDDSIIMQFTGLTDKNGVDIYEGDINKDGFVCEYSIVGCWFRWVKKSKLGNIINQYSIIKDDEVFGNVHQDKNLLK